MRVDDVVRPLTRSPRDLDCASDVIQLRLETEDIDDVDVMTGLLELIGLMPDDRSVSRPLDTGIHVRDKEDSHEWTRGWHTLSRSVSPDEPPSATLYRPTVSSTILAMENSRLSLASPASPIRVATVGWSRRYSILAASASTFEGGTRKPVSPSTTSSRVPPPSVATTGRPSAMYSMMLLERPSTNVH